MHKLKIHFTSPCENEHRFTLTVISFIDDTFELFLVVCVEVYLNDIRLLHTHAIFPLMTVNHNTTTRTTSSIIQ